jgi:hypothetical protein
VFLSVGGQLHHAVDFDEKQVLTAVTPRRILWTWPAFCDYDSQVDLVDIAAKAMSRYA